MRFTKEGLRRFTCLGRQESATSAWHEPDRYRDVLGLPADEKVCVQGAGLSLSGAGFSNRARVLGMARFNRILELDTDSRSVHVEAGITLGRLFGVLAQHGLILAMQPGHPDITVGGCIAGNVHGKNPFRERTFSGLVQELTLFHPAHGVLTLSRKLHPDLFDLTCGGFGLTGIILSARLGLESFPDSGIEIVHLPVRGLVEAAQVLREKAEEADLVYGWINLARHDSTMGSGFVVCGHHYYSMDKRSRTTPTYPQLRTEDAWPLPVFNRLSLPLINTAYVFMNTICRKQRLNMFAALFPFASRIEYFHAYGYRGFVEHQVLIPEAAFPIYAEKLMAVLRKRGMVCGLAALKLFNGDRRLLWYSGAGVSIAFHLPGGPEAHACLRDVDALDIEHGGIANIIKDARISGETVQSQYSGYGDMRHRLHMFDPQRIFISALSDRIGL